MVKNNEPCESYRQQRVRCLSVCGFHDMAYVEWGAADNPDVLLCLHGLTRNGRDFDVLAQALSKRYRVVCPDIVGRGRSDWLFDKSAYNIAQYSADIAVLLARLNVDQVDLLGTSMGGLIGLAMAAAAKSPIRRLILNDVGPTLERAALLRISDYVGTAPCFNQFDEAMHYMRTVHASFGALSEAQWHSITLHSVQQTPGGQWQLRYDPAIATPFQAMLREQELTGKNFDLWPLYEAIRSPVLAVRGATSDLLTADVHAAMAQRGPRASLAVVADCGHAPMFMTATQINIVRDWLAH